ncbi:MAG: CaiB/BaiF CoA-transferase family protein, partial [Roseovarius sp.]
SGYAEDGPMAGRKAYDLLVQAETGLCSITGGPAEPSRVGISVVDIATGATAHAAILEALIQRGVTGRGCHVSVSMFDVMADWLAVPLLNHEGGNSPERVGLAHPSIAPYGVFETASGPLLLSVQSDREWRRLAEGLIGDPALADDPRYATNVARCRHRDAVDGAVAAALRPLDLDDAIAQLEAAGIAVARLNDMAGLAIHPELVRIIVDTPGGPVALPAPAARFDGARRAPGPVPALGAS